MLEINLRLKTTFTLTTVPIQILTSRIAGDARAYLSMQNIGTTTTANVAPDAPTNGAKQIAPSAEYWEEPGGVPGNAFWAWTTSGTTQLTVWEG